jgi:hypothetical protein
MADAAQIALAGAHAGSYQEDEGLGARMPAVQSLDAVLQGSALDQVAVDPDQEEAPAAAVVQAGHKTLRRTPAG